MGVFIQVPDGHFRIVNRKNKFNRILMPGKHAIIPLVEEVLKEIPFAQRTVQTVSEKDNVIGPAMTADCIKVGFTAIADIEITDPEKHYKNDRWNTFAAVDRDMVRIAKDFISNYSYKEIVERFYDAPSNGVDITEDVLDSFTKDELIGFKITHIYLKPNIDCAEYAYWKAFSDYANNNIPFNTHIGPLSGTIEKEFVIPTNDSRYEMIIKRDLVNERIDLITKVKNKDSNFIVLYERSGIIENEIGWELDWKKQIGQYSTITMSRKGPTNKKNWDQQFKWLVEQIPQLQITLTEKLNTYGIVGPDETVETVARICSVCGAPLNNTNICDHCGARYTTIRRKK